MHAAKLERMPIFFGPGRLIHEQVLYARIGGLFRPVWLHWDQAAKRSRACTGAGCQRCPEGFYCWYAPGQCWRLNEHSGAWQWDRGVIQLTDSAHEQLQAEGVKPGSVIRLARRRRQDGQGQATNRAELLAAIVHATPPEQPWEEWLRYAMPSQAWERFRIGGWLLPAAETFDVRPALMRLWGLRDWPDQQATTEPPAREEPEIDVIPFQRRQA